MQAHNFSDHTLRGIRILTTRDTNLSLTDAYRQVEGLDYDQTEGVKVGLSREQVQSHNFGDHTLSGIRILRERDADLSLVDAYKQVEGLGYHQIKGIQAGLSHELVKRLNDDQIEGVLKGIKAANDFLYLLKNIAFLLIIRISRSVG